MTMVSWYFKRGDSGIIMLQEAVVILIWDVLYQEYIKSNNPEYRKAERIRTTEEHEESGKAVISHEYL